MCNRYLDTLVICLSVARCEEFLHSFLLAGGSWYVYRVQHSAVVGHALRNAISSLSILLDEHFGALR